MRQVRYGLFETNSSSVHSLIISTQDMFNKIGKSAVISGDEIIEISPEAMELKRRYEHQCLETPESLDKIWNDFRELTNLFVDEVYLDVSHWANECEWDSGGYVSPSGDKIQWCAYYGYDG